MPPTDLSLARRVDTACDRFEAAWQAGKKPRIEDFLGTATGTDRADLLQALISVEIELRRAAGESVKPGPYRSRFADDTDAVASAFAEPGRPRAAGETSVSRDSVKTGDFDGRTDTARPSEADVPKQIGRFKVTSVLGAGAFGRVYRAKDPQLGRDVAIKVPLPSAIATAADRERFLREAQAAAGLHHPNICPVHEVGDENGHPFIVMGYVPGQSLAATLKARKEPLAAKQAALIARKLALALDAAHKKGVVHRDLKPANVMFDKERRDVVVTDFGLARAPRLDDAQTTRDGVLMGTPAYMSPEQARGDMKAVGPASDQYALGVMLFEMLTGRRPFTGTVTEVLGKILHIEPASPTTLRADLDQGLAAVCMKAMAKDPAARYGSMKEFADALQGFASDVPARPATASADTAKGATETQRIADVFAFTEKAVDNAMRKHRTPTWMKLGIGMLILIGLVVPGIVISTRTPTAKVTIQIDVDIHDKSLAFFLDDKQIQGETLTREIELKVGKHVLEVKKNGQVIRKYEFNVSKDAGPRIELKEEVPPPPPPPPPGSDDQPKIAWKPLIRSADELIEGDTTSKETADRVVRFRDGKLELRGANASYRPKFTGKNYVLRASIIQFSGGKNVMFTVRREKGKFNGYQAFFNNQEPSLDWPSYGLGKHHVGKTWQGFPGTMRRVTDIYPVELAVSAFGNQIAIYVNGEQISSHTDDDSAEGEASVSLTETGHAVLRDLEVCVLDGTKLTPDDVFPQQLLAKKNSVLKPEYLTAERKKGNLLRNGSFEEQDPSPWKMESWRSLKESCTVIADNGRDGSRTLKIQNNLSDDVSYKQTVKVKPITRYLLSGWIKTRNVQNRGNSQVRGAHLYLWGGYERMTPTMTGTNDWTYFAVAFRSGNRTSVDLAARLGYFAGDVTGTAWFDDLCLIELPESDGVSELDHDGFVPLFNGKDLTGWSTLNLNSTKEKTRSTWKADPTRGVLIAQAGDFQELQSDRLFKNFTLRFDWRFTPGGSVGANGSGVVVRSIGLNSTGPLAGADPHGVEIDLRDKANQSVEKGMGTGCFVTYGTKLTNHKGKTEDKARHLGWLKEPTTRYDGEWNSCEISCQGDRIKVSMNGELVNEAWEAKESFGRIILRSQNTAVEFRKIEIKEFGR